MRPKNGWAVVMDDEKYFGLSGNNINSNVGYYAMDKQSVDMDIRYQSKTKYSPNVCVWIAISYKGYSSAYFAPLRSTIYSNIYANHCISQRLVPFLNKHHSNSQYIVWLDGATAHYARHTINTFERENVKYVSRDHNPPNIPQLRPIEKFWAHLEAKVYEMDWKAKDYSKLVSRIKRKLKEFRPKYFKDLMSKVKTRVRKAADRGHEYMFL